MERITVAMQGLGIAEIAYQNGLAYAMERAQGKAPAPRPDAKKPADPIIYHPEIRRMLLTIRSQVEGARALAVFASFQVDLMEKSTDEELRSDAEATVALLTPVIKSFLTDLSVSSALTAQQVFGGHGYICEHGMEQLVRDARITPIYEGTNEVQAVDLVMRKLGGRAGDCADRLFEQWQQFFDQYQGLEGTSAWLEPAAAALSRLKDTTQWIRSADDAVKSGAATHYQRLFALTTIASLRSQIVVSMGDKEGAFYEAKRRTALFYMENVLPEPMALHQVITRGASSLSAYQLADF